VLEIGNKKQSSDVQECHQERDQTALYECSKVLGDYSKTILGTRESWDPETTIRIVMKRVQDNPDDEDCREDHSAQTL
jgi:hypothetical protein